jgi:hypothetical protein
VIGAADGQTTNDMTIRSELLRLAEQACESLQIPPIRRVYVPDPQPAPARDAEFGVIELADGACGLYYAWMGDSQQGMQQRFFPDDIVGRQAMPNARSDWPP